MSTVASLPAAFVPASYQATLFGIDDPFVDTSLHGIERTWLDEHSWVDLLPRWMQGSDLLFGELVARLRWGQREVVMFDQLVLEPRLTAWWTTGSRAAEPAPVLGVARRTWEDWEAGRRQPQPMVLRLYRLLTDQDPEYELQRRT